MTLYPRRLFQVPSGAIRPLISSTSTAREVSLNSSDQRHIRSLNLSDAPYMRNMAPLDAPAYQSRILEQNAVPTQIEPLSTQNDGYMAPDSTSTQEDPSLNVFFAQLDTITQSYQPPPTISAETLAEQSISERSYANVSETPSSRLYEMLQTTTSTEQRIRRNQPSTPTFSSYEVPPRSIETQLASSTSAHISRVSEILASTPPRADVASSSTTRNPNQRPQLSTRFQWDRNNSNNKGNDPIYTLKTGIQNFKLCSVQKLQKVLYSKL